MKESITRLYILSILLLYINTLCLYHFQFKPVENNAITRISQESNNTCNIFTTVDLVFKTAKTEAGLEFGDRFSLRFKKLSTTVLSECICREHIISSGIIIFLSNNLISDSGPDIPVIIFPFHFFL